MQCREIRIRDSKALSICPMLQPEKELLGSGKRLWFPLIKAGHPPTPPPPATTPRLWWEGDCTAKCASQALSTPPAEDQMQSVGNVKRRNTQTLVVKNADVRETRNETWLPTPSPCKWRWLLHLEISIGGNPRSPLLARLHGLLESADSLLWWAVSVVGDLKLEAAHISQ